LHCHHIHHHRIKRKNHNNHRLRRSARNNINSLSSAVLVAIGMGPGTSAEVSLAIKNGKHVVLLAVRA